MSDNKNNVIQHKQVYSSARLVRDKHTKALSIEIDHPCDWKLFIYNPEKSRSKEEAIITGKEAGSFLIPVTVDSAIQFLLVTEQGNTILSETRLPMEGGYNFRDLGGIATLNGQTIQWGKLIRADELNNLSSWDLNYLSTLPLKTLVDFRSADEMKNNPNKIPQSIEHVFPLSIPQGSLPVKDAADLLDNKVTSDDIEQFMIRMYLSFVNDAGCQAIYRDFFTIVQQPAHAPLLFHCAAGKDRTGFATAMILSALGVNETDIITNYLETNNYLGDKYKPIVERFPQLDVLFTAKENYIETAINEIKASYSSIEKYLQEILNVDLSKIKQLYLE